jgi:hypothetical protein
MSRLSDQRKRDAMRMEVEIMEKEILYLKGRREKKGILQAPESLWWHMRVGRCARISLSQPKLVINTHSRFSVLLDSNQVIELCDFKFDA